MSDGTPSGVLVVDKAAGVTSFDAVALVRRHLGVRRVGHAGTLDPDAVGVLPVLIGESTKLVPYLMDQDKEYVAEIRLGLSTDTLDVSGRVLATAATRDVTEADVRAAVRRFVGRIAQVPPMYSAVHHEGRRLYELAREGIEVDRRPREVVVHSIQVEAMAAPGLTLRIVCGKGTYIRVLAADLGAALGCGAVVERLSRVRVGPFTRQSAVPWPELAEGKRDALWRRMLPPESALAGWPAVRLPAAAVGAFVNGRPVGAPPGTPGGLVRVHDEEGRLIGIGEAAVQAAKVRPVRILHADRPGTRVLPV